MISKNLVVTGRCGSSTSSLSFGLSAWLELRLCRLPCRWRKV